MATTTVTSGPFGLNMQDLLKGLVVAVITSVLTIITTSLDAGSLNFNWKAIGIAAASAGISYLIKNFFTGTKIIVDNPPQTMVTAAKNGDVELVKK